MKIVQYLFLPLIILYQSRFNYPKKITFIKFSFLYCVTLHIFSHFVSTSKPNISLQIPSDETTSESSSEIQNSATEISTDSEFAHDEPTPTREYNDFYVTKTRGSSDLHKPKKVQVKSGVLQKPVNERKHKEKDIEIKLAPLVPSAPIVRKLAPNTLHLKNEGYALNRTQSTGGIATKVSLELKRKYLLGETNTPGSIQKSGSASTLDTKLKSFHTNISDCQKLLKPAPEISASMKTFCNKLDEHTSPLSPILLSQSPTFFISKTSGAHTSEFKNASNQSEETINQEQMNYDLEGNPTEYNIQNHNSRYKNADDPPLIVKTHPVIFENETEGRPRSPVHETSIIVPTINWDRQKKQRTSESSDDSLSSSSNSNLDNKIKKSPSVVIFDNIPKVEIHNDCGEILEENCSDIAPDSLNNCGDAFESGSCKSEDNFKCVSKFKENSIKENTENKDVLEINEENLNHPKNKGHTRSLVETSKTFINEKKTLNQPKTLPDLQILPEIHSAFHERTSGQICGNFRMELSSDEKENVQNVQIGAVEGKNVTEHSDQLFSSKERKYSEELNQKKEEIIQQESKGNPNEQVLQKEQQPIQKEELKDLYQSEKYKNSSGRSTPSINDIDQTTAALTETELSDWARDGTVSDDFEDELEMNPDISTIRRNKKPKTVKKENGVKSDKSEYSSHICGKEKELKDTKNKNFVTECINNILHPTLDNIEFMDTGTETSSDDNVPSDKNNGYVQFHDEEEFAMDSLTPTMNVIETRNIQLVSKNDIEDFDELSTSIKNTGYCFIANETNNFGAEVIDLKSNDLENLKQNHNYCDNEEDSLLVVETGTTTEENTCSDSTVKNVTEKMSPLVEEKQIQLKLNELIFDREVFAKNIVRDVSKADEELIRNNCALNHKHLTKEKKELIKHAKDAKDTAKIIKDTIKDKNIQKDLFTKDLTKLSDITKHNKDLSKIVKETSKDLSKNSEEITGSVKDLINEDDLFVAKMANKEYEEHCQRLQSKVEFGNVKDSIDIRKSRRKSKSDSPSKPDLIQEEKEKSPWNSPAKEITLTLTPTNITPEKFYKKEEIEKERDKNQRLIQEMVMNKMKAQNKSLERKKRNRNSFSPSRPFELSKSATTDLSTQILTNTKNITHDVLVSTINSNKRENAIQKSKTVSSLVDCNKNGIENKPQTLQKQSMFSSNLINQMGKELSYNELDNKSKELGNSYNPLCNTNKLLDNKKELGITCKELGYMTGELNTVNKEIVNTNKELGNIDKELSHTYEELNQVCISSQDNKNFNQTQLPQDFKTEGNKIRPISVADPEGLSRNMEYDFITPKAPRRIKNEETKRTAEKLKQDARMRVRLKSDEDLGLSPEEKLKKLREKVKKNEIDSYILKGEQTPLLYMNDTLKKKKNNGSFRRSKSGDNDISKGSESNLIEITRKLSLSKVDSIEIRTKSSSDISKPHNSVSGKENKSGKETQKMCKSDPNLLNNCDSKGKKKCKDRERRKSITKLFTEMFAKKKESPPKSKGFFGIISPKAKDKSKVLYF